ncbi:hypothetical protein ACJRO7_007334 [Eucalyptus globulus]|uniref:Uncharacterized protein n=1 Tax=Eucalyptus globulus TaxID=34317 RepID=A0ABD3IP76_EUCGL
MVFTKKLTWKMAMAFKIFMRLYLGISWFLLAAAIPATRSLSSSNEVKSLPELKSLSLDGVELIEGGATHEVERRMDVEKNDYPGPDYEPRHDPAPKPTH